MAQGRWATSALWSVEGELMDDDSHLEVLNKRNKRRRKESTNQREQSIPTSMSSSMTRAIETSAGSSGALTVGSACGGWSAEAQALLALQIPFEIKFLCDSARDVRRFLRANVPHERLHNDVFSTAFIEEQHVDVFVAGPPCQPYSSEGRGAGSSDPRSAVINPILDYIKSSRPKLWVLENVPRFQSADDGGVFQSVMNELTSILGSDGQPLYCIKHSVLDSLCFGVPQRRRRLFVVGLLRVVGDFRMPLQVSDGPPLRESILEAQSGSDLVASVDALPAEILSSSTSSENVAQAIAAVSAQGRDPGAHSARRSSLQHLISSAMT